MNQQERIAWYKLAVIALAIAAYVLLIPVMGPSRAAAAFSLLSLLALSRLLTWRRRCEVSGDERDAAIHAKATMIAFSMFWVTFVTVCMFPYFVYAPRGAMPPALMPLVVLVGFLVFQLTQSTATVVQYVRGRQNAHG